MDAGSDPENSATAAEASETPVDGGGDPLLSVVVVTYEEADRIRDVLAAVDAACREISSYEVVLVDSNSTDETVAIASEFDVRILRITDDDLTTPAAGRYVGTRAARGEYLLYVDGDVELVDGGWIREGIERLQADPSLAGVDGYLNERRSDEARTVSYLHGVALYDAAALADVGGFHPSLEAWEDVDLGFELRVAGYELCRLPAMTGTHPDESSPFEQFRRWRHGYYEAGGQVVRKAMGKPRLLAEWLRYFADKGVATGWLLFGILLLVVAPPAFAGWLAGSALGTGVLCVRLGVGNGLQRALSYLLFPIGAAVGFRRVPSRESFPMAAVETVSRPENRQVAAGETD